MYNDKKAKKILFDTYWSRGGWNNERYTRPEEFEYAKSKGWMFDPLTISHDDAIKRIIQIRETIATKQLVMAFLSSLSTRRLELRSAIASYHIAKKIVEHTYTPCISGHSYENNEIVKDHYSCLICREIQPIPMFSYENYSNIDLNVMNFERIKWGGLRLGDLMYTLFDLEQFVKEEVNEPKTEDIEIFNNILQQALSCNAGDFPSVLRKKIKGIENFKTNKSEIDAIIEVLACIGVLEPKSYDRATSSKNEWTYIEYWRGEDGYNAANVLKYFGEYLK